MSTYVKHIIVIYSTEELNEVELSTLAREAEEGSAICADYARTYVTAEKLPESAASFFQDDGE